MEHAFNPNDASTIKYDQSFAKSENVKAPAASGTFTGLARHGQRQAAKQSSTGHNSPSGAGMAGFQESPIQDPFKTIAVPEKKARFEESGQASPPKRYAFMRNNLTDGAEGDANGSSDARDKATQRRSDKYNRNLALQQQTPSFSQRDQGRNTLHNKKNTMQ